MKKIYILLVLFLFDSCISDVELNLFSNRNNISVNCLLNPDFNTITAWISYTKPVLAAVNFVPVVNSQVFLYEEGKLAGQFEKSDSTAYIFLYKIKPGKKYKIKVICGNITVWGETVVPANVTSNFIAIENQYNSFDYKISFKDNPVEENYYWISTKGFKTYDEEVYPEIAAALYSDLGSADDFNRLPEPGFGYMFEYEKYIRINDLNLRGDSVRCQFYPAGVHITNGLQEVFVLSVDYHLDKYMKSSLLVEENDSYAEDVPIVYSPQPVYSNIHGGTGIFGSYVSISKDFNKN